jgi:hypothetical protein
MKRSNSNRGSAVLMVVGLLTILTLLGSAFLVVTYMDRQQSRAAAARSQVDPGMQGVISMMTAAALAGKHINTSGVYGAAEAGALGWTRVIDWNPGAVSVDANIPDAWLSPNFYGQFPQPTGNPVVSVDGSGDANMVAPIFPLGTYNTLGDAYFVAARWQDASSLICVSTAGSPDSQFRSTPRTGSSVNLQAQGMTAATLGFIVTAREGGGVNLQTYDMAAGQKLLQPDSNFSTCMPFGIGNEMFLRWVKTPAPTETGQLFQAVQASGSLTTAIRRQLTTYSVTDVRMPRPAGGFTTRINPYVNNDANAQATYQYVLQLIQRLALASDPTTQQKMAACFVANLMAYEDTKPGDSGGPWAFKPTSASFTAYGLTQRLVITEAYAAHKFIPPPDPANPDNNYAWACAVEVFNPTTTDISAANYTDSSGAALPTVTVPAGKSVVLYNSFKGTGYTGDPLVDLGLTGTALANWKPLTTLSFLGDGNFSLSRNYPGTNVPVDIIAAKDVDYGGVTISSFAPDSAVHTYDSRRDDSNDRARYNLAIYKHFDAATPPHVLGTAKAVAGSIADTDLNDQAVYGAPIDRMDGNQTALTDVGEMDLVYLIGPMTDASGPHYFPVVIAGNDPAVNLGVLVPLKTTRPGVPSPGRMDPAPKIGSPGTTAWDLTSSTVSAYIPSTASLYPDVPAGCLLSQFFNLIPPDATRGDQVPVRVYGRINVNTASRSVLAGLPYPAQINTPTGMKNVDANTAADYIASYRDKVATKDGLRNYSNRSSASGIAHLRSIGDGVAYPGMGGTTVGGPFFLAPDEVAIPLADYANTLMGWTIAGYTPGTEPPAGATALPRHSGYMKARDSIWRAVSNIISVNTDAAVANVMLEVGYDPVNYPNGKYRWFYIIAIDRSNCALSTDLPAVTLFAEVK